MLRNSEINLQAARFLKNDISERGLKKSEFGKIIGYEPNYIKRMLRGDSPVYFDVVVKYCSYFNIPLEDVIQSK